MKRVFALLAAAMSPALAAAGDSIATQYPGPWVYEFNTPITRALVAANVSGCGIYRYRVSRESSSEFLVYCSSDNENWTAYLVWPNLEKVLGPYPPDPSLP